MTFRSLIFKLFTIGLAAMAFAAPGASALEPFTHDEAQGLASRGIGAPVPSAVPATTKVDLRSPDATVAFSPSGRNVSPAVTSEPSPSEDFDWGTYAIVAAALAAGIALVTLTQRRQHRLKRALGV